MKVSRFLVLGVAGTTSVLAFATADAFTGAPSSGGPPASAGPDVVSATITRKVDPNSSLGPQVQVCFDDILNASTLVAGAVRAYDYDSSVAPQSTNFTIDTANAQCGVATFAKGVDIGQSTLLAVAAAGAKNNAGIGNPAEGAPLQGSDVTAAAGATTAPDLVSAAVDPGANPPQITYTFDENLDPALGTTSAANKQALAKGFGFYTDTDNGSGPRRGATVTGVDGPSITVQFTAAQSVNTAKDFFYDGAGGGLNARDQFATASPIGATGTPISASPVLTGAAKGSSPQVLTLSFNQAVIPGSAAGNAVAYRADGSPIGGTYTIGTSGGNQQALLLTMPGSTQNDPTSVVRVGIRPGLVHNSANDRVNTVGAAAVGTEPMGPGLTDGPDLLTTTIDDATNTVTYNFDEPLQGTPDGTAFRVIAADGTAIPGQANPVLSADRKTVTVHFSGSVSAAAGVSNGAGAVRDAVTDSPANGNPSPPGDVSTTIINGQPGTGPGTNPGGGTTTPAKKHRTTIKHLRKHGHKVTGKLKAAAGCAKGRKVVLEKRGHKIDATRSHKGGSFKLKSRKAKGKHLRVAVRGTATCKAATKKV